ncbi:hypothetical protein GQ44DRAFT_608737 [Phaeosphaeriaceae sp. PMI808]|nr:hypothetical protein GQ44DRAFT_608737 [Phaeosphaeriaceae sp. PMI808]
MQGTGRKRVVSSCIPCYTRKQKCNRHYPCNHCSRRRRPEECAYYPAQALQAEPTVVRPKTAQGQVLEAQSAANPNEIQSAPLEEPSDLVSTRWNRTTNTTLVSDQRNEPLFEVFGYFEYSESNTMALLRKARNLILGLSEEQHYRNQDIKPNISEEIQRCMAGMPDRQILDFLVQHHIKEVHWIEQLVHPPWFLAQYQQLWNLEKLSSVFYVEFVVLLMRICSYSSQFLPSPSYTIDRIRNMFLADIRIACNEVADKLAEICMRLDTRGSLLRVQHLAFSSLQSQCEGRINTSWETLNMAILVAQRAGLHRSHSPSMPEMHELEKEMRRRVFCNIYIWDSVYSRQLDRMPFFPTILSLDVLPRMHLAPDFNNNAPEAYSERLLQLRLANFWREAMPQQDTNYDPTAAEERYERFCTEFLATLPSVFALEPNEQWDEQLHRLPFQRQILHIATFGSLCRNFRGLLFQNHAQIKILPGYKQALLSSQKKALAAAALEVLHGVSKLHAMLGGSHTRFPGIVFPTFEAAVLLVAICRDLTFPTHGGGHAHTLSIDPLGSGKLHVTRDRCLQVAEDALKRLQALAEVSAMAERGALTLSVLLGNNGAPNLDAELSAPSSKQNTQDKRTSSDSVIWPSSIETPSSLDLGSMSDFLFTSPADISPSWDLLVANLPLSSAIP